MHVNMIDNGEPGVNDSISFVIVEGTADPTILSNIIYSSNWIVNQTLQMKLSGGNLVVHSGFTLGTAIAPGGMKANSETETKPIIITELTAKAWPNPSEKFFNLLVEGGNAKDEVQIIVYNASGVMMHQAKGTNNRNYKFGDGWIGGMYYVQVRQGNEVKTLQLMKQ